MTLLITTITYKIKYIKHKSKLVIFIFIFLTETCYHRQCLPIFNNISDVCKKKMLPVYADVINDINRRFKIRLISDLKT